MDSIEGEDVADFDVTDARHGDEVAWGKDVLPAEERRDDVLGGLGANEL
jgi:hypothetical protein